jgi:hypothetical protein
VDLILRVLARYLPDRIVQQRYVRSGAIAGSSLSYIGIGNDIDMEKKIRTFEFWAAEYQRRGYQLLSRKQFVEYGGYGVPLTGLGKKV